MFRLNKNNSVHTDVKYEVYNMRKRNNVLCGIFHDYCKDFKFTITIILHDQTQC